MPEQSAIVIGAGVAGLATAALLAREGLNVTVVERLDSVGGRSGEKTIDGYRFDTGPSWYLMPDAFDHFFALFGRRTEEVLELIDLSPAYRLFPETSAPIDVTSGRAHAINLFESLEPGAGKKLADYLESARATYSLALERFLYTTFSSPRPFFQKELRKKYRDLVRFLTIALDKFVKTRFADTRLRQILTYPAVFLSTHPARTPSMYHLMSHTDLELGVKYPQGGFTAVVSAIADLARENGATIRLNADVSAITYSGRRATGVRLVDGEALTADIVVSAADLHFTETRLLPPEKRTYDERWFASREPGLGTVLVMLGTDSSIPELAHHNLLFSKDWDDDFSVVFDGPLPTRPLDASRSIYVCKPSATDPSVAPDGCENIFILVPVPASAEFGHGDMYRPQASPIVEAIAHAAIEQLAAWCGREDLNERIVITRTLGPTDFVNRYNAWSGGSIGPSHTLWQSAFLRGRNQSRKLRNLYYAGATTVPGVGVPMCLISAENVLKRLRGDTSPGPLPEEA